MEQTKRKGTEKEKMEGKQEEERTQRKNIDRNRSGRVQCWLI